MEIPVGAQQLIKAELQHLGNVPGYNVPATTRRRILDEIGSKASRLTLTEIRETNSLPLLSEADYARARVALMAAGKVESLWKEACWETDIHLNTPEDGKARPDTTTNALRAGESLHAIRRELTGER